MNAPQPFKVDGWTIFKAQLASAKGWPVWTVLALGMIFIATGSVFDVRFLVIGFMICVAVVPGIASIIYFSYTLSKQIVPNMIPHTIHHTDEGYLVRIWMREETEDNETVADEEDVRWVQTSAISLSNAKIVERKTTYEYELLYFKDSPLKILYLPK